MERQVLHFGLAGGGEAVGCGIEVHAYPAVSRARGAPLGPDNGDAQTPAPSGVRSQQFAGIAAGGVEVAVFASETQAPALLAGKRGFGMGVHSGHYKTIGWPVEKL
jgi:hypothetical protein